jgi:polyhydroxybutyrate depolymerase
MRALPSLLVVTSTFAAVAASAACSSRGAPATGSGGSSSGTGGTTSSSSGAGGTTSSSSGTGGTAGASPGAGGAGVGDPADAGNAPVLSAGCGKARRDPAGGVQLTVDAGPDGDGMRTYWLSVPASYDPSHAHKLVIGYPGTSWTGKMIQPYFDLEGDAREDEIFVYPDPLWRMFAGWGNGMALGGWLLGPNAAPANGNQDLVFTQALIDDLEAAYCIDKTRVFATGHSWGGDMAQVVSCFMGDQIRASVPVSANTPYWFDYPPSSAGPVSTCVGHTAVWTFFGIGDNVLTGQAYAGQFGDQQRDFWLGAAHCTTPPSSQVLPYEASDAGTADAAAGCWAYEGCDRPTEYCLFGPATGHQVPPYYHTAAMAFFRSF